MVCNIISGEQAKGADLKAGHSSILSAVEGTLEVVALGSHVTIVESLISLSLVPFHRRNRSHFTFATGVA